MIRILTLGVLVVGLGITVALLLGGCGGGNDTSTHPPAAHQDDHGDHEGDGHRGRTPATQHDDHGNPGHDDSGGHPETPGTEPGTTAADVYPLDVCIVSGEKLGGEMGEPITYVHEGRTLKFCCKTCVGMFKKDPAKYLAKLDEAIKKAGGSGHEGHDH